MVRSGEGECVQSLMVVLEAVKEKADGSTSYTEQKLRESKYPILQRNLFF